MNSRYILVLMSLHSDSTDVAGHAFLNSGYVEAKDYKPDLNILNGLCGTVNGLPDNSRWYVPDGKQWRVMKVERNEDLITLDKKLNLVKFRVGVVVCSGDKDICINHIKAQNDSAFLTEYKCEYSGKLEKEV